MSQYVIKLMWDNQAAVWVATSDDIPGLILESGSLDALIERVRYAAPELLSLEGQNPKTLNMFFKSERLEQVSING